ncbi:MAG: hypothetical protein ACU826_11390 [Gammaproteobacteria bacterium]
MLDFVLGLFSDALQMNLRDHHDIPFALPLVVSSFTGLIIGAVILRFIGNEEKAKRK